MLVRFISAVLGVTLLFGVYYAAGTLALVLLCFAICLVASAEYLVLFGKFSPWLIVSLLLSESVLIVHTFKPEWTLAIVTTSFITLSSLAIVLFRNNPPEEILAKIQWSLIGLFYTGLFPAFAIHYLYSIGFTIFLYLLVTVFFGDIAAYFFGRFLGTTKILPNISPKKTYAGSIGGLLGSLIFGTTFLYYTSPFPLAQMATLSICIGAFGQFGDFFESLIKRVSGKKDTGKLMPGHGGFLDRLDGVYFGAVVLYIFCELFGFKTFF